MALQLSYTDRTGTTHSEAYVKIDQIRWSMAASLCEFYAGIYHNATTRSKSDESEQKNIVSKRLYHLSGSTYTTYLAEDILKAADKSLLSQLYAWLKQHVDTPTDPTGNPNMGKGIDWTTATDV